MGITREKVVRSCIFNIRVGGRWSEEAKITLCMLSCILFLPYYLYSTFLRALIHRNITFNNAGLVWSFQNTVRLWISNCRYLDFVTFRLAEQQSGLESNISKEEVDIRIKEENLGNILPTLEGIRKATLPLQESLGIPLDKKREEQDMALLLPS